jgi:hypothetical protein
MADAFETWANVDGGTHLHARLSANVLRGVRYPAKVSLPRYAGDAVKLEDENSHVAIAFALKHVQNAPVETASGIALYRGALDGADVLHRVHAEGTEDFVVFETPPSHEEISYDVDVSRVAGLRLVANRLELLDDAGAPRLRVSPPYVVDRTGASSPATLAVAGCAYDTSPLSPFHRSVTAPGRATCTVSITWRGAAYPAMVDPAWTTTGSLAQGRIAPTASVLPSGEVLIAGGEIPYIEPYSLSSAELYDPDAGTFAATGWLVTRRESHSAVVLKSGKPLLIGGYAWEPGDLSSAELYDPALGTFSETAGSMANIRDSVTATVLTSGKVLVAGGFYNFGWAHTSAELFDPTSGTFSPAGSLVTSRGGHSATLLSSGKVLLAGGRQNAALPTALASAELYDPISGTLSKTGDMGDMRALHTASLLSSGKVLVAGGAHGEIYNPSITSSAEIYDPSSGTFSFTGSMLQTRAGHTASVLPSDQVLIVGGYDESVELYDPKAGGFSPLAPLASARDSFTASTLLSGRVLIAGGSAVFGGEDTPLVEAELLAGEVGDACAKDGYCLSGFCVDGFCCDTRCDKSCDRCDVAGKKGTCSVAGKGEPSNGPACGYVCDGLGPGCPASCASDAACGPLYYCGADGTCKPRKAPGAGCETHVNCKEPGCRECAGQDANAAGYCVDGVCCDGPCDQGCEACAASLKQSGRDDGVCGATKDGTDPRNACAPSAVLCHEDGQCNGAGGCRAMTPAGVACDMGKACDGSGSCVRPPIATCDGDHTVTHADNTVEDCSPHRCNSDGTCRTTCISVADCVAPNVCDALGTCSLPPGDPVDTGCSVAAAPERPPGPRSLGWLALALAALCIRRRWGRITPVVP